MKKLLFLLIGSSILFNSCKKESQKNDGSSTLDYIEVTIDGQTYREEFPSSNFGATNQIGCEGPSKQHYVQSIGQIDVSSYFFDPYLRVYENDIDFKNSQPKTSSINPIPTFSNNSPVGCNLDFEMSLEDESFTSFDDRFTTLLKDQSSGNITSIKKISETSTDVEYRIIGTFSSKFKNKNNKIISVVGKFQTTTFPAK